MDVDVRRNKRLDNGELHVRTVCILEPLAQPVGQGVDHIIHCGEQINGRRFLAMGAGTLTYLRYETALHNILHVLNGRHMEEAAGSILRGHLKQLRVAVLRCDALREDLLKASLSVAP